MLKIDMLEKYIQILTAQITKLLNESAVPDRVVGVRSMASDSNFSDQPNVRLLEKSLKTGISDEDLSNFMENYFKIEQKLRSLTAKCKEQTEVIKILKADNKKLVAEKGEVSAYLLKLYIDDVDESCDAIKRKVQIILYDKGCIKN